MEKFEVYNRKLNKWDSENISIVPGWSENWVLDKTTDTMSLKLKYKSTTEPNFNVGDWCRILHAETPTYESVLVKDNVFAYKPLNHEQYIIGDITLVENKIAGEWDCQLKLKEPIEITSGILCETMSFTNQISKTVDGVIYTHEPLNHLSVLEKILKVTPANNDLQKSWWSRIKICNQAFLENIPFNDETYSEPSLYNILMDKYDSSVGKTPVLYFDMNPETDLPNDLTRETYILDFERQDGFDKEDIELSELTNGHNEIIINKSDENFTDGLVSNYDNLNINNDAFYPSENYYTVPEVDTNDRDLTTFTDSGINSKWVLRLPHKIKKIIGMTRYKIKSQVNPLVTVVGTTIEDYTITGTKETFDGLIYEEKEYNAESNNDNRKNAIWFTEGNNIIHINEMKYYTTDKAYTNESYIYCVNYIPLVDARYDLGKDYQTPINQVDSQIDSRRFGDYLKDYFASMNKADIIIQKTVDNFGDIKEVGTRVIDNDKNYIITNVSIQNRGYDYEVIYQLNENHFRKSDTIVAPQEIRKDIAIGIDATKERKSMLPFRYKISLINNNITDSLSVKNYLVSSLLTNTKNLLFIQTAVLNIKGEYQNQGEYNIERCCSIIKYILNDTFCFNMRYFDNAEAGKTKELQTKTIVDPVTLRSIRVYGVPNYQQPVLYTNYFGEFDKFDIIFTNINNEIFDNYLGTNTYNPDDSTIDTINNVISSSAKYPLKHTKYPINIIKINNINYYKDMLDTFNYTVGFHMESDESIILCKSFFNNSILITNNGAKISKIKTYSQNQQENDVKTTEFVEISNITGTINDNEITITLEDELNVSKCVVLVDTENNPIIIINDFDKIQTTNTFKTIKLYC